MKSIILISLIVALASSKFMPEIPMEKERFANIYSLEGYDFTFEPGKPQSISNPIFLQETLSCSISTTGSQTLFGQVTKGSGKLNGQSIASGG